MNRSKMLRTTALALAAGLCTTTWAAEIGRDLRSGQWSQWAFSIPTSVNPLVDESGQHCMVGQNGSSWKLAPNFGGNSNRSCTVPQGAKLQFMVAGGTYVYTPGFCGDVPGLSVRDQRAIIAAYVDTLTTQVLLNGQPVPTQRVRSAVFSAAIPADNLFTLGCGGPGSVPAGVFRSVDDGYFAEIENLPAGTHTLQMLATNGGGFNQNVVFTLTVVPRP
jgi:hypothetical protein